jgi:hypothetical protein
MSSTQYFLMLDASQVTHRRSNVRSAPRPSGAPKVRPTAICCRLQLPVSHLLGSSRGTLTCFVLNCPLLGSVALSIFNANGESRCQGSSLLVTSHPEQLCDRTSWSPHRSSEREVERQFRKYGNVTEVRPFVRRQHCCRLMLVLQGPERWQLCKPRPILSLKWKLGCEADLDTRQRTVAACSSLYVFCFEHVTTVARAQSFHVPAVPMLMHKHT